VVYGLSLNGAASHQAFIAKHQLQFSLVVSDYQLLATASGVLRAGFDCPPNTSSLLGPDGRIAMIRPKAKAEGHGQAVHQVVQGAVLQETCRRLGKGGIRLRS
jgi:peroxiredoxin Q/BCP